MKYLRAESSGDGMTTLLLDRPDRRNAIDEAMLDELEQGLSLAPAPVIVLASADPRWFCAGGDLSLSPDRLQTVSRRLYALYRRMLELEAVVVVAADGPAIGAGAQLLLAADLRVAGWQLEVSFAGAASGLALGTWGLPALVGAGRAMDLVLTGRGVGADEALRIGLVDRLAEEPLRAARQLAKSLADAPTEVLARAKTLVRDGPFGLDERVDAERDANEGTVHRAAVHPGAAGTTTQTAPP
jgi:enoyl-CoA hydratase/carnithine racemase